MQTTIHPKWYKAKIACACGNNFSVGATVPEINVEVCYNCHPYFTGQMKFVDTAGRVDAFLARVKAGKKKVLSKALRRRVKRERKIQEQLDRPDSLKELQETLKRTKKTKKS